MKTIILLFTSLFLYISASAVSDNEISHITTLNDHEKILPVNYNQTCGRTNSNKDFKHHFNSKSDPMTYPYIEKINYLESKVKTKLTGQNNLKQPKPCNAVIRELSLLSCKYSVNLSMLGKLGIINPQEELNNITKQLDRNHTNLTKITFTLNNKVDRQKYKSLKAQQSRLEKQKTTLIKRYINVKKALKMHKPLLSSAELPKNWQEIVYRDMNIDIIHPLFPIEGSSSEEAMIRRIKYNIGVEKLVVSDLEMRMRNKLKPSHFIDLEIFQHDPAKKSNSHTALSCVYKSSDF